MFGYEAHPGWAEAEPGSRVLRAVTGAVPARWRLTNPGPEGVLLGIRHPGGRMLAEMFVPASTVAQGETGAGQLAGPLEWVLLRGDPDHRVLLEVALGPAPAPAPEASEAADERALRLVRELLGARRFRLLLEGRLPILSRRYPGLAYTVFPSGVEIYWAGPSWTVSPTLGPDQGPMPRMWDALPVPLALVGWPPQANPRRRLGGRGRALAYGQVGSLCVHADAAGNRRLSLPDNLLTLYLACRAGEEELWLQGRFTPAMPAPTPAPMGEPYPVYPAGREPAGIAG